MDGESNSAATWSVADRAAYRQFLRTHHPDVGGDPAVFTAGVQRFHTTDSSAHSGNADPFDGPVFFVTRPQGVRAFLQAMLRRRRRRRHHRRVL